MYIMAVALFFHLFLWNHLCSFTLQKSLHYIYIYWCKHTHTHTHTRVYRRTCAHIIYQHGHAHKHTHTHTCTYSQTVTHFMHSCCQTCKSIDTVHVHFTSVCLTTDYIVAETVEIDSGIIYVIINNYHHHQCSYPFQHSLIFWFKHKFI